MLLNNMFKYIKLLLLVGFAMPLIAYADPLDDQVQADLNQFLMQFKSSPVFSAVQISILLPNESEPRDYVAGVKSIAGSSELATNNMLLQYGSLTKEFTSSLLIKYINQPNSNITLNSTLLEIFPEKFSQGDYSWPDAWKNISIENLMNMTSGIPSYTVPFYSFNPNTVYYSLNDLSDLISKRQKQGCIESYGCFPVGKEYFYSNSNYILLGMVIESLYGESFTDIINSNILYNLQKDGSNIYYDSNYPFSPTGILESMISGYYGQDTSPYVRYGQNVTNMSLSWVSSAGAMLGNMHALVITLHKLFNGEIFSNKEAQVLTQSGFVRMSDGKQVPFSELNTSCNSLDVCYGLGVAYAYDNVYGPMYSHDGLTYGYGSFYTWFPKYNVLIAIGFNSNSPDVINQVFGPISNSLFSNVTNQVMKHITGKEISEKLVVPPAMTNTTSYLNGF